MKKVKGFTLIELIVVIAIIGILAAILVPAMMGWVNKSRITTYNNNASEICTKLQALVTDMSINEELGELDTCTVVWDGEEFNGLTSAAADKISAINKELNGAQKMVWAARLAEGEVKSVACTGNNCVNVGGFPYQCPNNGNTKIVKKSGISDYLKCADGSELWVNSK